VAGEGQVVGGASTGQPPTGGEGAAGAGTGEVGAPPVLVVSACLLGVRCNHRGGASPSPAVVALGNENRLVPICPEVAGGLPTPRPAAEVQADGTVLTESGSDVTDQYRRGAGAAVELARVTGARGAVLKARSPSCGPSSRYDGTFTRTLVATPGLTARALADAGLPVCSEEDLDAETGPPGHVQQVEGGSAD
jgi:uncharacterized protein YbbK (DUF523 family)